MSDDKDAEEVVKKMCHWPHNSSFRYRDAHHLIVRVPLCARVGFMYGTSTGPPDIPVEYLWIVALSGSLKRYPACQIFALLFVTVAKLQL